MSKAKAKLPYRRVKMLADMLLEMGRPEDALVEYEKSMSVDPNRFNGLYGAARAAELSNQRDKATSYFSRLLANCGGGTHSARPELGHAKFFLVSQRLINTMRKFRNCTICFLP